MSEQDTSTTTLPTFTEEYRTHDRSRQLAAVQS